MQVKQWIQKYPENILTVRSDDSLQHAAALLLKKRRDIYVVDETGQLLGHLSYKRISDLVLAEHRSTSTRRQIMSRIARGSVRELMDAPPLTANADEELEDVIQLFLDHDIEDLPVLDESNQLIGAINLTDLLQLELFKTTA